MKHLLIGIAAGALDAAGVQAGPGNGRGQGNDKAQQARGAAAGDRGQGPSMSSAAQDRRYRLLNGVYRAVAAENPAVGYFPTRRLSAA